MIISAILSLRYNIPCRASRILNPALNLLIKSSISRSGGLPTPAFHIPQDLSTIFAHLQAEPVIQICICCPQCFFLNGLAESVTTDQPINAIMSQMITIPFAHNHDTISSIHLNPTPKTQPTSKKDLSQQNILLINHSKIGFPDSSSVLEL
ncbi:hypothetical protein O181_058921 [Austropuccinia psidii MF-1]|uniref:Uncharacterized protein n=1 Tax=Austropuccinia psidii MF-1 TaxID=1389203 RepID=A0A9Q3HVA2_9BASI|nr:hypothetical protein [Austropuccinia psidii MF-1]